MHELLLSLMIYIEIVRRSSHKLFYVLIVTNKYTSPAPIKYNLYIKFQEIWEHFRGVLDFLNLKFKIQYLEKQIIFRRLVNPQNIFRSTSNFLGRSTTSKDEKSPDLVCLVHVVRFQDHIYYRGGAETAPNHYRVKQVTL